MGAQNRPLRWCGLALLVGVAVPGLRAQAGFFGLRSQPQALLVSNSTASNPLAPPATLEDALHTLFSSAEDVFAGEVTGIERTPGAVTVRWRVDEAVRGVQTGTGFALREWPGLWADGDRYFVGERALVMLHAPSAAGFASPVGGGDGIVPLRGDGAGSALDLRLLARRVAGNTAARQLPMAVRESIAKSQPEPLDPVETTGSAAAPDRNGEVDGSVVLGMLQSWQRGQGSR